jgi:hypothetical protein
LIATATLAATTALATAALAATTALAATLLTATTAHAATTVATRRTGGEAIRSSAYAVGDRHPEVPACSNTPKSNHGQQKHIFGEIDAGFLTPQTLDDREHRRPFGSKGYLIWYHAIRIYTTFSPGMQRLIRSRFRAAKL